MKRTVIAVFALCMAAALAGCTSGGGTAAPLSSSSSGGGSLSLEANDTAASPSAAAASSQSASAPSSAAASDAAPEASSEAVDDSPGNACILSDFTALSQYPDLPNGCEVTSLAALLNYEGYPVDKGVLSDEYLPKGPVGSTDFHVAYVGNPREDEAYGCYAPVLVACANAYLADQGSAMSATDLTGTGFRSLFSYIDQGIPVIVWGTQYCQEGYYTVTWHVNGQDLTWFRPEHCMVLVGYDLDQSLVYVADPMEGAVLSYDLDLFESRYNSIFQQAIVIR